MAARYAPTDLNELTNDVRRGAVLGVFTPNQETKADKMKGVTRDWGENGLWKVTMHMHDGTTEIWQQTDVHMDAKTGFKYAAFKRLNKDGSIYLAPDGKPEAVIAYPGSTNNKQDLHTFKSLTQGGDIDYALAETKKSAAQYNRDETQRSKADGLARPHVLIATHSCGSLSQGAGADLAELGWPPESIHVVNVEPVGAGAGLKRKATLETVKDPKTGEPNPLAVAAKIDAISQNMVSVRMPDTLLHVPGGGWERANNMTGHETYRIASAGGINPAMSDHELASAANVALEKGSAAMQATPWDQMTGAMLVHDKRLSTELQQATIIKSSAFIAAGPVRRKGPENAYDVDQHIEPFHHFAANPQQKGRPNYSGVLKINVDPSVAEKTPAAAQASPKAVEQKTMNPVSVSPRIHVLSHM